MQNMYLRWLFVFSIFFTLSTAHAKKVHTEESHAQENDTKEGHCVLEKQYAQHSYLHPSNNPEASAKLENMSVQFANSPSMMLDATAQNEIVIPVVFHVMRDSPAGDEDISIDQIRESLVQVNEDFNLQNARRSGNIYSDFLSIEANVGVRFELAKRDPDGYPTDGVTRTTSVFTRDGGQIELKETIQWPRDRYLNIWVVASSDGGNGSAFAFLPPSVADRPVFDGIVTSHWAVGRTGTARDTHLGNLTHEIGHWANLNHTWGGGTNGNAENCSTDDGVSDTPNTVGNSNNNLCGSLVQSCNTADNISNFMDYSCEVMYTEGQKARMLAALNSSVSGRNNTWSQENKISTGIDSSPVFALFKADSEWILPGEQVVFTDESETNSGAITSWQWSFPGGTPSSYTGQSPPAITYNTAGVYEVSLTVSNSSGSNTRVRKTQVDVNNNIIMNKNGTQTVNVDNGWFYDSGFKSNYDLSESGVITLRPETVGRTIEVDFYEFNMEDQDENNNCAWDFMEVFDGTSTSANLIGKYCGKAPQAAIRATNNDGALTIRFTSDGNTVIRGWRAKVSAVDPNVPSTDILMGNTSSVTKCGVKFFDSGKNLPYKNSENSTITFNPEIAGRPVTVDFISFETEADNCQWDFLEIFDGTSTSATQIGGKYCGTDSPGSITANNSSGALTFKFTSDGNTTLKGWEANVSCETSNENQAPVANANGPYSGTENSDIQFSSAGSNDPDGTIVSYEWTFGDGATGSGVSPSHAYEAEGTYSVTLKVTDDKGASDTDTASVTVTGSTGGNGLQNGVPKTGLAATQGNDVRFYIDVPSGASNFVVAISGASGDGDADLYTRFDAEPTDTQYTCRPWKNGNIEECTQANPSAGRWHIRVKAYNSFSNVTLTASYETGNENQNPTANSNGPYSATLGDAISFSSAGSSDPDGSINGYEWNFGDGTTSTEANPSHIYSSEGNYTVTLTVTDDKGATGASSTTAEVTASTGGITDACASEPAHVGNGITSGDAVCIPTSTNPNAIRYFWIQVPPGTSSMSIQTAHGTGDGNLYYRSASWATASSYDQRSSNPNNTESITVNNPPNGYRFISVIGAQSGMTLLVELQ